MGGFGAVGEHGVRQAEVVVLGDDDLARRSDRTPGSRRVAPHLERAERLLERVVREQPADERVAEVEQRA